MNTLYTLAATMGNATYNLLYVRGEDRIIDLQLGIGLLVTALLLTPVVLCLVLPMLLLAFIYVTSAYAYIYRLLRWRRDPKEEGFWDDATQNMGRLWDNIGRIWHGYELEGFENIPAPGEGPALLIFYHGTLPVDYYYLMAKCILHRRQLLRAVGDHFLYRVPGWKILCDILKVSAGTRETCTQMLREGHVLSISPGGVMEALFSDEYYGVMWGKRVGFARVALEAKAPIIPMFTVNIREAFRPLGIGKSWLKKIYERMKLPLVLIYGGFPVKLRTIIGKPIPYNPNHTPEELAQKVTQAMERLISERQTLPGNVLRASLERFYDHPKLKMM